MELDPYQLVGAQFLLRKKRGILGDDPGLGKTAESLAAAEMGNLWPAVVVTLASTKYQWADEVQKWMPWRTTEIIIPGKEPTGGADLTIINWDLLRLHLLFLTRLRPKLFIEDEFHYAKTHGRQRTEAAQELAWIAPHLHLLSGTPMLNRPEELATALGQIGVLGSVFGGYDRFVQQYCGAFREQKGKIWVWNVKGATNLPELRQRLQDTCFLRRERGDVGLDLPARREPTILRFPLSNATEYRLAETDVIEWLLKGSQVGFGAAWNKAKAELEQKYRDTSELVALAYLRRLTGVGKIRLAVEWARHFLASSTEKLLIFAHHRDVVMKVSEALQAPRIAGDVDSETREQIRQDFQNNPNTRILVLNTAAGGVGLNLQAANNVLVLELPWTPSQLDQAISRAHRRGQQREVGVWIALGVDTCDYESWDLIRNKQSVIDAAVGGRGLLEWLRRPAHT